MFLLLLVLLHINLKKNPSFRQNKFHISILRKAYHFRVTLSSPVKILRNLIWRIQMLTNVVFPNSCSEQESMKKYISQYHMSFLSLYEPMYVEQVVWVSMSQYTVQAGQQWAPQLWTYPSWCLGYVSMETFKVAITNPVKSLLVWQHHVLFFFVLQPTQKSWRDWLIKLHLSSVWLKMWETHDIKLSIHYV